jgi:CBS domain-containing protein
VPVIAADGRLVGIVTSTDVIEALADDLQHAGAASPPRHDSGAERDTASASGAEVKALHDVFRAVRNYLASGRAETEHTRLVQAADRARDALRAAGIDLAR